MSSIEQTIETGIPKAIADGVWCLRLPLQSSLDHVNVYFLEDDESWVMVDTGSNVESCRSALLHALEHEPLSRFPVRRVLVTHHHPDHVGLAGLLVERGANLFATRYCWLYARMLQMDDRELPCEDQIQFAQRSGLKGIALAAYCRQRPSYFSQHVLPLPFSFQSLKQGQSLAITGRRWTVHIGNGHATGHATLWSDDGLAITGDQIMSGIASNLSVHPCEPDADLVSEWLDSCRYFQKLASDDVLCLPGHNAPFKGARTRCGQLIANVEAALERLLLRVQYPCTAVDCLDAVYRRRLRVHEQNSLIAETVGFLNHLLATGRIQRELTREGVYVWHQ